MCRRSSGCGCRALLENQAVETMGFVLGSQVGLQKWKHLEPVIFKTFGVSLSGPSGSCVCCVSERWFSRALQITKDPCQNTGLCPN